MIACDHTQPVTEGEVVNRPGPETIVHPERLGRRSGQPPELQDRRWRQDLGPDAGQLAIAEAKRVEEMGWIDGRRLERIVRSSAERRNSGRPAHPLPDRGAALELVEQ